MGYQPTGNALLVDDVISTGTSLIESIKLINASNSNVVGVLVAFDRMEVGKSDRASVELSTQYSLEVHSLINLDDILEFVMENNKYKQYTKNRKERKLLKQGKQFCKTVWVTSANLGGFFLRVSTAL